MKPSLPTFSSNNPRLLFISFFQKRQLNYSTALAVLQNKNQSDVLELKKLKEENQVLRNENEDLKKISKEYEKKSNELTKQNLKAQETRVCFWKMKLPTLNMLSKVSETKRYLAFQTKVSNNFDVNNSDCLKKETTVL